MSSVRKKRWVVYAEPPFGGPEAVLANLSRYTHRVAIFAPQPAFNQCRILSNKCHKMPIL